MKWVFLLIGLESIAVFTLLDCFNRDPGDFAGGAPDRQAWIKWLWVAVATAWFGVGNGIVLGYYYAVVKRNSPFR